jgi:hypothetical protein
MRTQHPAQVLRGRWRSDARLLLDARERRRNGGAPIAAGTHHLLAQDVECAARVGRAGQWGAPLTFAYLPDVLTYLVFGIVMAACLWFVDSTLKDDAD